MQELVPEPLFSGRIQMVVIGVENSLRRLDLVHDLDGLGQGQRRAGAPLHLDRRHVSRHAQQRLHALGKFPRGDAPVSNPFFRHG